MQASHTVRSQQCCKSGHQRLHQPVAFVENTQADMYLGLTSKYARQRADKVAYPLKLLLGVLWLVSWACSYSCICGLLILHQQAARVTAF